MARGPMQLHRLYRLKAGPVCVYEIYVLIGKSALYLQYKLYV